jgi:hypothetical protein
MIGIDQFVTLRHRGAGGTREALADASFGRFAWANQLTTKSACSDKQTRLKLEKTLSPVSWVSAEPASGPQDQQAEPSGIRFCFRWLLQVGLIML